VSGNEHPVRAEPEAVITWGTRRPAALEFNVNFGIFAGREVSRREIERLGEALLPMVAGVSIAAEHRYELGERSAVALHQVHVEIGPDALPAEERDIERLRSRIARTLDEWLEQCLTGVSGQELTHSELLARDAVVDRG
jgi:hypothetical protein